MTSVVTAVDAAYIPGTTSGPYPARPGNRVRPFIDGPQIMRRIGEAIANARHSVWLTVAFYSDDFLIPDAQERLFDVLDRAVARGVDVRLLIWRPNPETAPSPRMFGGSPEQAMDILAPFFERVNSTTFMRHIEVDPDLDPIREEPRFRTMLASAKQRLGTAA